MIKGSVWIGDEQVFRAEEGISDEEEMKTAK